MGWSICIYQLCKYMGICIYVYVWNTWSLLVGIFFHWFKVWMSQWKPKLIKHFPQRKVSWIIILIARCHWQQPHQLLWAPTTVSPISADPISDYMNWPWSLMSYLAACLSLTSGVKAWHLTRINGRVLRGGMVGWLLVDWHWIGSCLLVIVGHIL